jgi:hypothetical protein
VQFASEALERRCVFLKWNFGGGRKQDSPRKDREGHEAKARIVFPFALFAPFAVIKSFRTENKAGIPVILPNFGRASIVSWRWAHLTGEHSERVLALLIVAARRQ